MNYTQQLIKKAMKVIQESKDAKDLTQLPVKIANLLKSELLPKVQGSLQELFPYNITQENYGVVELISNVDRIKIYKTCEFECDGDVLKNFRGEGILSQQDVIDSFETIEDNYAFITNDEVLAKFQKRMEMSLPTEQFNDIIYPFLNEYNTSVSNLIKLHKGKTPKSEYFEINESNEKYFNQETVKLNVIVTDVIYTKSEEVKRIANPLVIDVKHALLNISKGLRMEELYKDFDVASFANYGDLKILKYYSRLDEQSVIDTIIYELRNWSTVNDKYHLIKLFKALCEVLIESVTDGVIDKSLVEYQYSGHLVLSLNFSKVKEIFEESGLEFNFKNQEPIKIKNSVTPNIKYVSDKLKNYQDFIPGESEFDTSSLEANNIKLLASVFDYAKQIEMPLYEFIATIRRVQKQLPSKLIYYGNIPYLTYVTKNYPK